MSDETILLSCPFCGGEAEVVEGEYGMYLTGYAIYCKGTCGAKLGVTGRLCEAYEWTPYFDTEAEAIAAWNSRADYHGYEQAAIEAWESVKAWNSRAELGSKPPYDELLRCLENDWNIRASWDGLRKFWSIELTEEGVRLRDAELNSRAKPPCDGGYCPLCGAIERTIEDVLIEYRLHAYNLYADDEISGQERVEEFKELDAKYADELRNMGVGA